MTDSVAEATLAGYDGGPLSAWQAGSPESAGHRMGRRLRKHGWSRPRLRAATTRTFTGDTGEDYVWQAPVPYFRCPRCRRIYTDLEPLPDGAPALSKPDCLVWFCAKCRLVKDFTAGPTTECPAPTPHTEPT